MVSRRTLQESRNDGVQIEWISYVQEILLVPERMATKRGAELVGNPNYGDDYDLYVEQAKRGDIQ